MEGTIAALDRRGGTVQLDPDHADQHSSGPLALPAGYVGEHLSYGYAITADSAQGTTIDHGLYAPTGYGSLGRGYVALTRGAISSRIYATSDNGWRPARRPYPPPSTKPPTPTTSATPPDRPACVPRRSGADPARRCSTDRRYRGHETRGRGLPAAGAGPAASRAARPRPAEDDREPLGAAQPASVTWLVPLPEPPSLDHPNDEPIRGSS